MTLPDPTDIPPAQHGGKREPGPGKKQGRPPKDKAQKAVNTSITFSSQAAVDALKAKAKAANKTPGALIEQKLKLSPRKKRTRP